MAIVVALLLMATQWAYTLTDQADEQHLSLRTQYGTLRIVKSDEWGCGYLLANQNVQVLEFDEQTILLAPESFDWSPVCKAWIVGQVDEAACFTNGNGDCDVRVEND